MNIIGQRDHWLIYAEPTTICIKGINMKNHLLYSSKFTLSVVNLNQIEVATEEDKKHKIDY